MPDAFSAKEIERASQRAWRVHIGPYGDDDALLRHLSSGSLAAAFHETALARPDALALTIESEWITHGELDHRAGRVAGWLRAIGVGPGDRVLLCGSNSVALVVAYAAALRVGAIGVPAGATLTEHELAAIVARAHPVVAFADGPALAALRAIASDSRKRWEVVGLSSTAAGTIAEATANGESVEPVDVPGSATALLAFTSGTTGKPKGVPLSHANLLSSIRAAMLAWRWSPDDVLVHALPLSHQHGLGGVHATLLAGSRATIHARFDAERLAQAAADDRATLLFAVPTMYRRLVEERISPEAFASLRLAISGSAPLSPELFDRISESLGQPPLERYGTTESGLDTSNPHDGTRMRGSVGLPLPGVTMAIVGPDGMPLEPGSDGEIVLRGPQVFAGYSDDPDTAAGEDGADGAAAFSPGGWFRTGDIGHVDPSNGFLSITGRANEVIVTGGLNVFPREVELALETHPDVGSAVVIGAASKHWGEEVVTFVVPSSNRSPIPDDLIAHAGERLAAYKCPKRVIVIQELPLDSMGKVDRRRLREIAGPT